MGHHAEAVNKNSSGGTMRRATGKRTSDAAAALVDARAAPINGNVKDHTSTCKPSWMLRTQTLCTHMTMQARLSLSLSLCFSQSEKHSRTHSSCTAAPTCVS